MTVHNKGSLRVTKICVTHTNTHKTQEVALHARYNGRFKDINSTTIAKHKTGKKVTLENKKYQMSDINAIIVVSIIMVTAFVLTHEETHATIFKEWGCEDVHLGIDGYNVATFANCEKLTTQEHIAMAQSQNNVEAYQYPMPLFILLLVILIFRKNPN